VASWWAGGETLSSIPACLQGRPTPWWAGEPPTWPLAWSHGTRTRSKKASSWPKRHFLVESVSQKRESEFGRLLLNAQSMESTGSWQRSGVSSSKRHHR
jgi:hypothetical protein